MHLRHLFIRICSSDLQRLLFIVNGISDAASLGKLFHLLYFVSYMQKHMFIFNSTTNKLCICYLVLDKIKYKKKYSHCQRIMFHSPKTSKTMITSEYLCFAIFPIENFVIFVILNKWSSFDMLTYFSAIFVPFLINFWRNIFVFVRK